MATPVPQERQARASGENLNYATLAPQARPLTELLVLYPVVRSLSSGVARVRDHLWSAGVR